MIYLVEEVPFTLIPKFAHEYDVALVRKLFHIFNLTSNQVLNKEEDKRLVMFRSDGYEEEYTIEMIDKEFVKVDEYVFMWSDKYDNYKIYLVNYAHYDTVYPDESKTIEWDYPDPYGSRPCPHCGDGGCPSCKPKWFI
jgi:hypothetical protein